MDKEKTRKMQKEILKEHYKLICKEVFGRTFKFKEFDLKFFNTFHQRLRMKRLVPKASKSLNSLKNLNPYQLCDLKNELSTIFEIDSNYFSRNLDLLEIQYIDSFSTQRLKNHYILICKKVFGEQFKFKQSIEDFNAYHNSLYSRNLVPNVDESLNCLELLSQDQVEELKKELKTIFIIDNENIKSSINEDFNIDNKSYILSIPVLSMFKKARLNRYFKKSNIISQIDYDKKSIDCYLKMTPKKCEEMSNKILARKTYSKNNSFVMIYPSQNIKQSNRNHLIPYCLTGIENDFRMVILASTIINDEFRILEDLYKKMVEKETYIYHTKAYINTENQLIINQEILDKNLNLLFKKDYVDENYVFDTNIPTIANIK